MRREKELKPNTRPKKIPTKILAVLFLFLLNISIISLTSADEMSELNDQINRVQKELGDTQKQKSTLQGEIAAFDSQIYMITLQVQATQAQLNKTQSEIDQTLAKIKQAEDDLQKQKETLKENLKVFYEEGQVSSIEVIASSDNFSEYMDRSEYLRTLQSKIVETVDKINALRAELEGKKKDLETKKTELLSLKNQQNLQRSALTSQKSAKDSLLAETKGLESNYQKQLGDLYAKRVALSRRFNEGSGGGGSGGYPYGGAQCGSIDQWSFYACQCTSYVAWKSSISGPVSGSMLKTWGSQETANGGDWGRLGRKYGYTVNSTPTAGSIMVFPYWSVPGGYGHVAYVTSVNGDGTVNVSEYNYSIPEGFGTRTNVNPANYGAEFIH